MKFIILLISAIIILILTACGGAGGDTTPIGDLSGTWRVTGTESSATPDCDGGSFDVIATVVQSENNLTSTDDDGSSLAGTISGNKVSLSGTYPEDGGTTVVSSLTATVSDDCKKFSGSESWSWTDGTFSCSGTSTYSAARLTGSDCVKSTNSNGAVAIQDFEDGLLTGWTVGGRQISGSGNLSGVQNYASSNMAYLSHTSFTELTLSKSFDFSTDSYLSFDAEFSIDGNTSPTPNGLSNFYSMVYYGIDFYDALGTLLGNINYVAATTNFPFSNGNQLFTPDGLENYEHDIPLLAATLGLDIENIVTFDLRFGGYSSWWSSQNMTVRFDNVKGD